VFFFRAPTAYDEKAVRKHVTADVLELLAEASKELDQLADWSAPAIHELISGFAAAKGISLGKLAQPIRLAVCGGTVSPPIDATLAILGKIESLARLIRARAVWGA
jgi:glutamyl-tRNA synthetase